ncbi:MAG TPA: hypothetical protein VMM35_10835, partial [Longimicrobiales bacterium]|nr:hypothetical protein [Longimicrobiales bacterium]
ITAGAPVFRAEHMESLLLFDETTLRPILRRGVRPNSDFRPVLDLRAERARFENASAVGVQGLATSSVDLPRLLRGDTIGPRPYHPVPSYTLAPAILWGRGAWLREAKATGGGIAPEHFPAWQNSLVRLGELLAVVRGDSPGAPWAAWATEFERVESELHWGTVGWADSTFYREAHAFLDRADAPAEARAVVDLKHGLAVLDWERVASAADVLIPRVALGQSWMPTAALLDAAVVAYLRVGRPTAARNALNRLGPGSGRGAAHLRNRLLDALIAAAEREIVP